MRPVTACWSTTRSTGSTYAFFNKGLTKFGITVEAVDMTDSDALSAALKQPVKAIYLETPANPNLRIIDLAAVSVQAREAGALMIVDNTFATPALQQPLAHGADLVVHSATKYLGGHGDLLAGAVVGAAELVNQIRLFGLRFLTGATISPWNAFMVLRGLKTLSLRMARHSESGLAVARHLAAHRAIDWGRLSRTGGQSRPSLGVPTNVGVRRADCLPAGWRPGRSVPSHERPEPGDPGR